MVLARAVTVLIGFMPTVWYPDCLYHCPEGRGSPDQSSQACDLQWYRYCSAPCPAQYIASRRSLFSEYGPSRRDEKDSPHRSSTMATPNEHPSLDPSMGNLFIGLGVFSTMLYGFSCTQFIYYLRHYWTRDRPAMRCLVLFIWLLDTVVTVSDSYILWFYLVQRHGRLSSLLVSPKLYELEYATTGAITCIVQIFYVRQMWQLLYASTYRMRLLNSMIPAVLSVVSLACNLVGVYVVAATDWIIAKALPLNIPWTVSRVWTAAVVDVYICVALSRALNDKRTGFKSTDSVISILIAYVVNRGILSMIVQIVLCGTYIGSIRQSALTWLIPHCAGCKIYVNSMMAVMNAREHVRNGLTHIRMSDFTDYPSPQGSRDVEEDRVPCVR